MGLAVVALLAGLWGGLVRLGLNLPAGQLAAVHGPVMVLGAVGTLIALERAVALSRPWAYAAPLASGLGALVLLGGGPPGAGRLLFATGGLGLVGVFVHLYRRQPEPHFAVMGLGAALWPGAVGVWAGTGSVPRALPWLVGFLVLTIVGERLELSRLAQPSPAARRALLTAVAVFMAGLVVGLLAPGPGARLAGLALLAQSLWLLRYDVAPRLARRRGATRFTGLTLTGGYAWLAVAGVLWGWTGAGTRGSTYDAAVHAVFVGFVMSMIFGHAPVILPAVLRVPLPFHPALYLPVGLLHVSLAARIAGDLAGSGAVIRWAGMWNVAAVLGFVTTIVIARVVSAGSPSPSPRSSHA